MSTQLESWNEGATKTAILEFVDTVTKPGPSFVPSEERIATFDADGTLWCEHPLPVEADFLLRRLAEMAKADPTLRDRQPWKAAYEHDNTWLGAAIAEHYAGNDDKAKILLGAISGTYAGISVQEFEMHSDAFLRSAQHPTLGRGYLQSAYAPMIELLAYLEAHGFTNLIVSGSGADFMRPISQEVFGIPPERVIGSTTVLEYASDDEGSRIMRKAALGFLDDGAQKPIQIWSHLGRRPLIAGGNSNGDIPMLDFANRLDKPSLRLLILHNDAEREFAYRTGAENALTRAGTNAWTIVSMYDDFGNVFAETSTAVTP
ncbi:MAG TPA: HAD family hydrolase [Acidimicrobiia bacterium]|nr:HAD family hydrolase [Acidimicrobiia bacterium]